MAWIESHTNLHRHPKIIKTQRVFGWDNDQAVGKMMKFWHWCLEFADSGVLDAYDAEDIAAVFGVTLDPSALVQRMVAIGWLDDDPVLRVHDWLDYAGKYLHAKYHTSNPEKLNGIYAAHGRIYGKNKGNTKVQRKSNDSPKKVQRKPLLPNLTSSSSLRSEEEPNLTLVLGDASAEAQARGGDESSNETPDREMQAVANRTLDTFHVTPELEAWSAKEGIPNPGQYVEEFRDYWLSTGGKRKSGQPIKDWDAAFRNRLRSLKEGGKLHKPSFEEQMKEWVKEGQHDAG